MAERCILAAAARRFGQSQSSIIVLLGDYEDIEGEQSQSGRWDEEEETTESEEENEGEEPKNERNDWTNL